MWKAPTPVERQADARDAWSAITGVNHSKKDTTSRLQELFPEARTHNKEASKSSFLRDRLLGAGIATGAVAGGMYMHNRSKKNKKGISNRALDRASSEAAYQKSLELGGAPKSSLSSDLDRISNRVGNYFDENPGQGAALGAVLGGTAAGLGGYSALKRLSKRAV